MKLVRELIRAWDPVAGKIVWEHETSSGMRGYDGGIMSTAGNLVFQGRGSGGLWVYAADTGKVLKIIETGSHIMAAPTTYAVNGEQYVAVQVGYGGTGIAEGPIPPAERDQQIRERQPHHRVEARRRRGTDAPRARRRAVREAAGAERPRKPKSMPARSSSSSECSRCHALGINVTPDLRRLDAGLHAQFKDIVLHGLLAPAGMERFDDILSERDVEDIHAYLIDQSLGRVPGTGVGAQVAPRLRDASEWRFRRSPSFETNPDSGPDRARRRRRDRVLIGPIAGVRTERAVRIERVGSEEAGSGVALVE